VILRYFIYDDLGNHFEAIVQAPSHEEGDRIAQKQADSFKLQGVHFEVRTGSGKDISDHCVLVSEAFDHETGTTYYGQESA
jgi:hypothetical protein